MGQRALVRWGQGRNSENEIDKLTHLTLIGSGYFIRNQPKTGGEGGAGYPTCSKSIFNKNIRGARKSTPDKISDNVATKTKLKRRQRGMSPNKKKRNNIVEIGTGSLKVTIYTLNRKDGFPEFTLAWKEGGQGVGAACPA